MLNKQINIKAGGFTLIEVTVALSLVIIVFAGLVDVTFPRMMQTGYSNRGNLLSVMLAQECMSTVMSKRDAFWNSGWTDMFACPGGLSLTACDIGNNPVTTTKLVIDYDGNIQNISTGNPLADVTNTPQGIFIQVPAVGLNFLRHSTWTDEALIVSSTTTTVPIVKILVTTTRYPTAASPKYLRVICQVLWKNREYSNNYSTVIDLYNAKPGT